jgi:hypothetical protein
LNRWLKNKTDFFTKSSAWLETNGTEEELLRQKDAELATSELGKRQALGLSHQQESEAQAVGNADLGGEERKSKILAETDERSFQRKTKILAENGQSTSGDGNLGQRGNWESVARKPEQLHGRENLWRQGDSNGNRITRAAKRKISAQYPIPKRRPFLWIRTWDKVEEWNRRGKNHCGRNGPDREKKTERVGRQNGS